MKHSNIICLRLNDTQLELLNHVADRIRLSRSDYLRNLILNHKMTARYKIVIECDLIKQLIAGYGKTGSNLNQIAQYFNTGGERSKSITAEIQRCLFDLYILKKRAIKDFR